MLAACGSLGPSAEPGSRTERMNSLEGLEVWQVTSPILGARLFQKP